MPSTIATIGFVGGPLGSRGSPCQSHCNWQRNRRIDRALGPALVESACPFPSLKPGGAQGPAFCEAAVCLCPFCPSIRCSQGLANALHEQFPVSCCWLPQELPPPPTVWVGMRGHHCTHAGDVAWGCHSSCSPCHRLSSHTQPCHCTHVTPSKH